MKVRLALVTAALVFGAGTASAEVLETRDRFMSSEPKETVYATERHMLFSIRIALIDWLGGVPVAKESELRAAQREMWWGPGVQLLPHDAVPRPTP